MPVKNPESNQSNPSKFAEKLSKSFFDLTHGSHDRLLKWKTKLQQQYGNSLQTHHKLFNDSYSDLLWNNRFEF